MDLLGLPAEMLSAIFIELARSLPLHRWMGKRLVCRKCLFRHLIQISLQLKPYVPGINLTQLSIRGFQQSGSLAFISRQLCHVLEKLGSTTEQILVRTIL